MKLSSNEWKQIPPDFFLSNNAKHDVSKLKTQGTVKSNIVISAISSTSFIDSETTVLLHLTSFAEDLVYKIVTRNE